MLSRGSKRFMQFGIPSKNEGVNGDIIVRNTSKGTFLFAKCRNRWYSQELNSFFKKSNAKNISSCNIECPTNLNLNAGHKVIVNSGGRHQNDHGLYINGEYGSIGSIRNVSDVANGFFLYDYRDNPNDYFSIIMGEHGVATLATTDDDGTAAHMVLDADGDIELNADGGDITFKDASASLAALSSSGLTVSNISEVGSDTDKFIMSDSGVLKYVTGANLRSYIGAGTGDGDMTGVDLTAGTGISIDSEANTTSGDYSATITCNLEGTELVSTGETGGTKFLREDGDNSCSWQTITTPFTLYSSFQDDVGTTKHYLPLRDVHEQTFSGSEQAMMMVPFNMTLRRVAMRCNTDISGATWTLGFWNIPSGTTDSHHHTNGKNWVSTTGGAQHTNCFFDFRGTVGLAGSASGGSNAITAGSLLGFQLSADTDVTSTSSEFWLAFYFVADLSSII